MKLPPVHDPYRYAGLYVYDFGDHVSVGYTANEVRMLRALPEYRGGTAYEIYRVDEHGAFELRGSTEDRLGTIEAICFLRESSAEARRDYEALCATAHRHPIGACVELVLAKAYEFAPSDVTVLIYAISSSQVVSTWLHTNTTDFGDAVEGGTDAHCKFMGSSGMRITTCQLAAQMDYADRSLDVVKAHVDRATQR